MNPNLPKSSTPSDTCSDVRPTITPQQPPTMAPSWAPAWGRIWKGLTLVLLLCIALPAHAAKILFVHAPSGGVPSATDQALVDELTRGLGQSVKLRPVSSAAEKPAANEADAVDLVIVSESVGSGNVTDAFKDVTKPVLLLEAFIADDMLVAVPGTVGDQTQADILNPDHPLAAGLSGIVDLYKSPKTLSTFTSASPDAIKVASALGQPETGALVAFLPGAKMESDFVAPGRRVCLGLHSAVPEAYTSQARALFRAAVGWTVELPLQTTKARTKPVIARQPVDTRVFAGQQAELLVDARGSEPLSFQWMRGATKVDGATSSILRLQASAADDGAVFTVEVRNDLGSVLSQAAKLKVLPDDGRKMLVEFSEGSGITTANGGNLEGKGTFAMANGYPQFSKNVPTGSFTPPGNVGSVDFGTVGDDQGGRAVDFTNPFGGSIGSYNAITICGWLNSRDLRAGPGGNRIAFAAPGIGGAGFDLIHTPEGTLKLGVNQAPDSAPESSPVLTEDPNAGSQNWIFFAVTYDSASGGNVAFYFGRGDAAAALDVTSEYAAGTIARTGELTLGNLASVDLNRNVQGPDQSRIFRGLMDEVRVFGSALTLAEIQNQQKSRARPTVDPVPLSAALSGQQIRLYWPATGTFVLESIPQLGQGTWTAVSQQPTLGQGVYSVTLPTSSAGQFYRLRVP